MPFLPDISSILGAESSHFSFSASGLPPGAVRVTGLKGEEAVSQPFRYEIMLASESATLDLESLIGQPGSLSLRDHTGVRHIHGIIESFQLRAVEALGTMTSALGTRYSYYAAVLVPSCNVLAYRSGSRVFWDKSVLQIVEEVFTLARIDNSLDKESPLKGSYTKREFCAQYQETDLAFVSRLLEEEGIYYYFEHTDSRDLLVLGDDLDSSVGYTPAGKGGGDGKHGGEGDKDKKESPPSLTLKFVAHDPSKSAVAQEEVVFELKDVASLYSGGVMVGDYAYKKPDMKLRFQAQGDGFQALEHYYYPADYVNPELGERFKQIRLEEQQSLRRVYRGKATSYAIQPGHKLQITDYPSRGKSLSLFVLRVENIGRRHTEAGQAAAQDEETCPSFEAIPLTVRYRPARITPRPRIFGLQTALVVGSEGDEIHCDEDGRIKVQFQWDRDPINAVRQTWIRFNTLWAGKGYGNVQIPRVGTEVLVQFLEGDPDRPLAIGSVYNGNNPFPYKLPDHKTRSTWRSETTPGGKGFNELRFEDKKGQEEVFLHAQKDFNEKVLNCHTTTVSSDQTNTVNGAQTETVTKDQSLTVTEGNRTVSVKAGFEKTTIQKDCDLKVVAGNYTVDVTAGEVKVTSPKKIELAVGSNKIVIDTSGISINGAKISSVASSEHEIKGSVVKINC